MAKLNIASIRLTRVSIPLTLVHAGSMYVIQKAERTVVELTLDNGVTGLGDCWGTPEVFAMAGAFGGGGHYSAAGFQVESTIADIKSRLIDWVETI